MYTETMFYVVAVSGGVDSVVLLDMLVSGRLAEYKVTEPRNHFIVAHFDHGIRPDSAKDAVFVNQLASKYGLRYETCSEKLGPDASEEKARQYRYAFLHSIAQKYNAVVMTAHHADDLIETVAINIVRGTGWRGLAAMGNASIKRPLLAMSKVEIIQYAKEHSLDWREDVTNQDDKYLRNKLRKKIQRLDANTRRQILRLRDIQVDIRQNIDNEVGRLIKQSPYERYVFIHIPENTATELLRSIFIRETGQSPTRPVLQRALHAIKVFHGGKKFDISATVSLRFTKTHFVVEVYQ